MRRQLATQTLTAKQVATSSEFFDSTDPPLSANLGHSCALLDDNDQSVVCWGNNDVGQLGNGEFGGNKTFSTESIQFQDGTKPVKIAVGRATSCAVMEDETLQCWGRNSESVLGNPSAPNRNTPSRVTFQNGTALLVKEVAFGMAHQICAIMSVDGSLRCWGRKLPNPSGEIQNFPPETGLELPNGLSVRQVSIGVFHACALLSDESVRCFGDNVSGQLGDGTIGTARETAGDALTFQNGTVMRAKFVSAGGGHSCAILSVDDTVRCWGFNGKNDLGVSGPENLLRPSVVPIKFRARTETFRAKSVSTGFQNGCAHLFDDTVHCWGNPINNPPVGGIPSATPSGGYQVSSFDNAISDKPLSFPTTLDAVLVKQISLGREYSCAVLHDSTVRCWGLRSDGALNGTVGDVFLLFPLENEPHAFDFTSPLTFTSTPTTTQRPTRSPTTPKPTFQPTNTLSLVPTQLIANQIVSGSDFSCALLKEPISVVCWGGNIFGTHGQGTALLGYEAYDRNSIQRIRFVGDAIPKKLFAGGLNICAKLVDDTLQCWGVNQESSLGIGSEEFQTRPVQIRFENGTAIRVKEVLVSDNEICAMFQDSSECLTCWGRTVLEDNIAGIRPFPTPNPDVLIPGEVVKKISPACMILNDDSIRCFGEVLSGEAAVSLGYYELGNSISFQNGTILRAKEISSNFGNACAILTADDTIRCWGFNERNQTGVSNEGSAVEKPLETPLSFPNGTALRAKSVLLCRTHACAILLDGRVSCWGSQGGGALGDGVIGPLFDEPQITSFPRAEAVSYSNIPEDVFAKEITCGDGFTCVRVLDDSIRCWGSNFAGQMNGTAVAIPDFNDFEEIIQETSVSRPLNLPLAFNLEVVPSTSAPTTLQPTSASTNNELVLGFEETLAIGVGSAVAFLVLLVALISFSRRKKQLHQFRNDLLVSRNPPPPITNGNPIHISR